MNDVEPLDRFSAIADAASPIADHDAAPLLAGLAGRHVLLAVSGGLDSMAMLHLVARSAANLRIEVSVAIVDHRLRDASAEIDLVRNHANELRLPFCVLPRIGGPLSTRLQEQARTARYHLLVAHARAIGASHIVTAHTLDDQAETILFRMARGSGLDGLAGMRPLVARGGVLHARPLLGIARAALGATLHARGVAFIDDPSNVDERFARVRWRRLMPHLAAEGLTASRLARLAERLARAEAALDARAAKVYVEALGGPDGARRADVIAGEPFEIVVRVLRMIIRQSRTVPADAEIPGSHTLTVPHLRLDRLEALAAAMVAAVEARVALKRSFAGLVFDLDAEAGLRVGPAPPRRHRAGPLERPDVHPIGR